jgi:hypothetical protein
LPHKVINSPLFTDRFFDSDGNALLYGCIFFDSDEIPFAGCISLLNMHAPGYRFTTESAAALPGCPVSG